MSEIVERLRADTLPGDRQHQREARIELAGIREEAANEIERLRAALAKIAQHDMQAIAMDALRPGERVCAALPKGENDV
jgi:low affinity Fe/Cu permease